MVQKKLQGWKAKLLSQADRTTLISSVLLAMPLYTFSCFRILDIVCSKFAAITRAFWWDMTLVLGSYIWLVGIKFVNQSAWVNLDWKSSLWPCGVSHIVWRLIWKVKLPLKILTFIWKLLHDSLPVFEVLNNRGITISSKCLMCNEDEESINHLFMHCPFARVIWHGSNLEIRTLKLCRNSVKQWVEACILQNEP